MNPVQRLTIAALRHAGYVVLPPPSLPAVDSAWTPTRTRAGMRVVVLGDGGVWYAYTRLLDGRRVQGCRRCAVATWHRWVRRTRAVRS